MKSTVKNVLVLALAVVSFAANAAVDVASITSLAADVALVGAAVFGILVAIKGVKMIRAAL